MPYSYFTIVCLLLCIGVFGASDCSEGIGDEPSADRRLREVRDGEMTYSMPHYGTKAQWEKRKQELRRRILVSAGLWPEPPKTPLKPRIFGRIERPGYTIEKVYFESVPGLFCTGNLYRPSGVPGRKPGVLSPHGHWSKGRLEDGELGSIPARCISLARQGYVVFAYDMVGYNDSLQVKHDFGGRRQELWGITLLGLQLLNSIRAVDFLCSLPDVDPQRIGCTGASGGGTQTYLLSAVDDRVKAAAPVNMVSAHYQGGCLCENAPGLRTDTFNVEIAAMTAPRPLLLVSATGDWTVNTPKVEYPAIKSIYALYGAEDRVHSVQFDAPHNYNRASREAVYAWFGRWLLSKPADWSPKEEPYTVEPDADMRVFPDGRLPEGALTADGVTEALIRMARENLEKVKPRSAEDMTRFREIAGEGLRHALCVKPVQPSEVSARVVEENQQARFHSERLVVWRTGVGDRIPAVLYRPRPGRRMTSVTLLVHGGGIAEGCGADLASPSHLVTVLLRRGHAVMCIDPFLVGSARPEGWTGRRDVRFFTTFNLTDTAERVQDVMTALAYLRGRFPALKPNLMGCGTGGFWCLLAAGLSPGLRKVAVDACGLDTSRDETFMGDLFVPGLRRAGDVRVAGALCAPTPLLIHNTRGVFETDWIEDVYRAVGAPRHLRIEVSLLSEGVVADWLR